MLSLFVLVSVAFAVPQATDKPAPNLRSTVHIVGPRVDINNPDKPVLIEVWATWCGACRLTLPLLGQLQREHSDLSVVALTDEDPVRVRRFVHQHQEMRGVTVLTDTSSAAMRSLMFGGFGASGLPSSYLIDQGKVVWAGSLDDLPAR
ncbi:MAG: thiol-disulfide isomerase/thioredoxin [Kiritimatiellia bacterium]|jgi:thiol-disulfide isomerase/thioredoxin